MFIKWLEAWMKIFLHNQYLTLPKQKQNIFKQFKQKKNLYSKAQLVICCIIETVMK